MFGCNTLKNCRFVEILPPPCEQDSKPTYVEAYVASVEARRCGLVVSQVSNGLPASRNLSHLKRVRRRQHTEEQSSSCRRSSSTNELLRDKDDALMKRLKTCRDAMPSSSMRLDVLLGSCSALDEVLAIDTANGRTTPGTVVLAEKFGLPNVFRERVPGRPAESRAEWEEFNGVWPTTFYPLNTAEHKVSELDLTDTDKEQMIRGICSAIMDSKEDVSSQFSAPGAVIVNPTNGEVISRASNERTEQKIPNLRNPLETSIILAIQGVSRIEREVAAGKGMDSQAFQGGQYLCTGLDVYTTAEPSVFDAMALVHSRIRRVIFFADNASQEPYVKGLTEQFVHRLPGTNHKFRAFQCQPLVPPTTNKGTQETASGRC